MSKLPKNLTKYFWGDDLTSLDFDTHKQYITRTLLDHGDLLALRWLFRHITPAEAKQTLSSKMRPKSLNFWRHYLT